jgi:hypothetical protein
MVRPFMPRFILQAAPANVETDAAAYPTAAICAASRAPTLLLKG